jgi:RNA polymerase sigma-70 factor (ECF subfamily)
MARLQNRDHNALKLLFDRYSKLVFCVVVRVLHDTGEAEDMVQEVFTHLYQKASLFDPGKGTAKSWILRAAFRRALDRQSYLTTRRFYPGAEPASLGDMLYGNMDWECQIIARLSLEQLRRLFDDLSEEQRQTLRLFFFEGMTFHEIAEKLDEPLGNVRHYYYRGLGKLRESFFVEGNERRRGGVLIQVKVNNHE